MGPSPPQRQRAMAPGVVGLLLGALLATAAPAKGSESPPGGSAATPMATGPSDPEVRSGVLELLRLDPHLDAERIEVSCNRGIVELSGQVATPLSLDRARKIAACGRGVRMVVSRLRLALARRPDRDIAREVRLALLAEPATAKMPITVHVKRGVVTLTGAITSWTEQDLAERIARSVRGVRFCLNNLTTRRAPKRTSEVIAADVRSRLAWDPLTAGAAVVVSVDHGVVLLSGSVSSAEERLQVAKNSRVMGVVAVDFSRIVIAPGSPSGLVRKRPPTDPEIAAAVQDSLAYYFRSKPPQVGVSVAAGVVTLTGSIDTFAQAQVVETLARGATGSLDVQNDLRGPWWKPKPKPTRSQPVRPGFPKRR